MVEVEKLMQTMDVADVVEVRCSYGTVSTWNIILDFLAIQMLHPVIQRLSSFVQHQDALINNTLLSWPVYRLYK